VYEAGVSLFGQEAGERLCDAAIALVRETAAVGAAR
jgi:hypothetical protein